LKHKSTFRILHDNYKVVLRLMKYSRDFRISYMIALVINAFTMIRFSFVIGFSVQWVTDSAINRDWVQLEKALWFAGIVFVINSVLYYFEGYLMQTRVEMIMAKVKVELFSKIMHLSSEYHDKEHSGDLQSRITSDLEAAGNAISFTLVDPINFCALGIVNLVLIALISYKMAFICMALVAVVFTINTLFIKRIQHTSSKIQSTISAATERLSDMIHGISIVKIFNLQNWINERYDSENRTILFWQSRQVKASNIQQATNDLINNVCNIGVIGIGALLLAKGEFTPGALLAIFRYSSKLVFAFTGFGNVLSEISRCIVGASRVMEILDLPEERQDGLQIAPELSLKQALRFDKVSFAYENNKILDAFSLEINTGETIAVVGPSGAGKSTLLQLVMGLYSLAEDGGKIYIRGKDMTEYSLSAIRQCISYVSQSNYLFSGTIRDNIAYGKSDASEEEIIQAAKAAYAHDFISKLPHGYNTYVGDNGIQLSGGERQRIAIARALLKDASILLLDEPTAFLDPEAEQEIQKALEALMKGKTVIVAAHRLATVKKADKIVVLENGRIVEADRHEVLIKQKGRYAHYYKLLYD
jgi:ATP-binding cassette subfamily B protein